MAQHSAPPAADAGSSLFFYGTLMAPSVLARVIGSSNQPPRYRPAILKGHRRHRVKGADYPAVVPEAGDCSVRGTLAQGLSRTDIRRLDMFEGPEYTRRDVEVEIDDGGSVPEPLAAGGEVATAATGACQTVATQTYIWIAARAELEDAEWDFEQFRRDKLHIWAGAQAVDEGMQQVDEQFASTARAEAPAGDSTRGRSVAGGEFERLVAATEQEGTESLA